MANYTPNKDDWIDAKVGGSDDRLLKKPAFDAFNPSILGLGNLRKASRATSAVAAVFDLEGFTTFCRQIDPHFAVPEYLGKFVPWLLTNIKEETKQSEQPDGIQLWHALPFFTKFMGDGILVLWNTEKMGAVELTNIIVSMHIICEKYEKTFLSTIRTSVVDAPPRLRCGIARGTVFSVGDDADYVGSCINMAARVQKLPGVSFAFNRRGFDLEDAEASYLNTRFVVKKVAIRGIGDGELIGVLTKDIKGMSAEDKTRYRDP